MSEISNGVQKSIQTLDMHKYQTHILPSAIYSVENVHMFCNTMVNHQNSIILFLVFIDKHMKGVLFCHYLDLGHVYPLKDAKIM